MATVKTPIHRGERFAAVDKELAGSRTSAPIDKLLHEVGCRFVFGTRRTYEGRDVLNDVLADRDRADEFLEI